MLAFVLEEVPALVFEVIVEAVLALALGALAEVALAVELEVHALEESGLVAEIPALVKETFALHTLVCTEALQSVALASQQIVVSTLRKGHWFSTLLPTMAHATSHILIRKHMY